MLLVVLLLASAAGTARPPMMTPYQQVLVGRIAARAANASAAATPALLEALGQARLRGNLSRCCPTVASLSAPELLARLEAEVRASEVVHAFEASTAHPSQAGCDVDLALLRNATHLPNLWELIYDGERAVRPLETWGGGPADAAETGLFGFRTFSPSVATAFDDIRLPTLRSEAAERPVYTAMNIRKVDAGIPMFGPISLVLNPAIVRPMAVLAPCDTGWYETSCNITWQKLYCGTYAKDGAGCNVTRHGGATALPGGCVIAEPGGCVPANGSSGQKPPSQNFWSGSVWSSPVDCSGSWLQFDRAPGTYAHFRHLLLSGATFWGGKRGEHGVSEYLARLLVRLFGDLGGNGTLVDSGDEFQYFEAETVGTLRFPESVKLVLGSFDDLFGSALGYELQTWCREQGWLLAWAVPPARGSSQAARLGRLLDPTVLSNTSSSIPPSVARGARGCFQQAWKERGNQSNWSGGTAWRELWVAMPGELRLSQPRAGSCVDDAQRLCVGASETGACVCYSPHAAGPSNAQW
jgi:hypothetical protein